MFKNTNKHGLYACWGCGDITTGAVSQTTGKEYACCPCCCERTDESGYNEPGDDDRGPYRERQPFPRCPKCKSHATDREETELYCHDCEHVWTPRGIYMTKAQAAAFDRAAKADAKQKTV